jgi:hypothetical protein
MSLTESESDGQENILNARCHRNEHMPRKTKAIMAAGTTRNHEFVYEIEEVGTTYICAYNCRSRDANRVTLSAFLT